MSLKQCLLILLIGDDVRIKNCQSNKWAFESVYTSANLDIVM